MDLLQKMTTGVLAAGLMAGCWRGQETDEANLDVPPMIEESDTPPPRVYFPSECQQKDPSLNAFVDHVLDICKRGDYDKFCGVYGTNDTPPSYDDFKRIWNGVAEIAIQSIHAAETDPPQYFVHAVVKLRREDAEKRLRRDVVVRVFRELDEWRVSGAPKEIVRKVLIADSQPASAPAPQASGVRAAPATAPASAPGVYKADGEPL